MSARISLSRLHLGGTSSTRRYCLCSPSRAARLLFGAPAPAPAPAPAAATPAPLRFVPVHVLLLLLPLLVVSIASVASVPSVVSAASAASAVAGTGTSVNTRSLLYWNMRSAATVVSHRAGAEESEETAGARAVGGRGVGG
jgi:hypothetical protein